MVTLQEYPRFDPDAEREYERAALASTMATPSLYHQPALSFASIRAILYGFVIGAVTMLSIGIPSILFGIAGGVAAIAAFASGFVLAKVDEELRCKRSW